jgi:nitroimidazol reductase NimA-like FMN-containing flavoprotein (pyridoxamine 5'-phosphate oxidase superfamily)
MLGCTGLYDESSEAAKGADKDYETPGSFPTGDERKVEQLPPGPRNIYLHGHASARLFQQGKEDRLPVTVAASSIQGIVLALAPFHNSCNYSSAVVQGYASIVTSESERLYALTRITDNLVPERWDNGRKQPTNAELTSTGVLKVEIESASAKVRVGGPSDDRADLKNDQLVQQTWTGVIPTWTTIGEPVPSSYNRVARLPGYLKSFVEEGNEHAKTAAVEAITKAYVKK